MRRKKKKVIAFYIWPLVSSYLDVVATELSDGRSRGGGGHSYSGGHHGAGVGRHLQSNKSYKKAGVVNVKM